MTAACISTGCRKLCFQWTTGKRSDDHPSWKEPGASTVSSMVLNSCQQHGHVFRHCYEVRTGMRRGDLYECVWMWPKFWISSKAFAKLICQLELYWPSSDAQADACSSAGVSCSSLQVSEVFTVRHYSHWEVALSRCSAGLHGSYIEETWKLASLVHHELHFRKMHKRSLILAWDFYEEFSATTSPW